MYIVVDTTSRNVLGECETLAGAKSLFLDLVAYNPPGAPNLEILSESGEKQDVPPDEMTAALEAAVSG